MVIDFNGMNTDGTISVVSNPGIPESQILAAQVQPHFQGETIFLEGSLRNVPAIEAETDSPEHS